MQYLSRLTVAILSLGMLVFHPGFSVASTPLQPNAVLRVASNTAQAQQLTGVSSAPQRIIPAYWQKFPAGKLNAISDVSGVQVGQLSLFQNKPDIIRTGLTAIVPHSNLANGNLANTGFPAAASVLNGNGEMTGLAAVQHSGLLNGPIVLTNTPSVGIAHQGVWQYFQQFFPGQWESELPVIAECWDGFFNTLTAKAIVPNDVITVIQNAIDGPVPQGRIGAGTGMRSFGLHAGIGSASRKISIANHEYTIGILVNINHSKLEELNPLLQQTLETHWGKQLTQVREADNQEQARPPKAMPPRQGSIIIIIATDLPLDAHALQQLADHAALGVAQTGGTMATTSGDFALAFSTANAVRMGDSAPALHTVSAVHPQALTPIFQAMIEAIMEAQLNALVAAHSN